MVNYHVRHTQLPCPPLAAQQAALIAADVADLAMSLDLATDPAQLSAAWQRAAQVAFLGSEALASISAKIV